MHKHPERENQGRIEWRQKTYECYYKYDNSNITYHFFFKAFWYTMLFLYMIFNCCTFWRKLYYPYFMHKGNIVQRARNLSTLTRQAHGESVAPSHGLKQTQSHFGGQRQHGLAHSLFPSKRFMTLDIRPALIREEWLASADLGRHSCSGWALFHVDSCLARHVRGAGVPWPLSSTTGCCSCDISMPTSGAHSATESQSSREQS